MKNQKGFSLVELLVVVIIIAIIAAIAIPSLLASRRAANEASAINSLRTYHSAQSTYQATTGLGVDYAAGSDDLVGLVDALLADATPQKSGYDFSVVGVASDPAAGTASSYCANADPTSEDVSGTNFYGVGVDGVIYRHTASIVCPATGVLTVAGSPIQ